MDRGGKAEPVLYLGVLRGRWSISQKMCCLEAQVRAALRPGAKRDDLEGRTYK